MDGAHHKKNKVPPKGINGREIPAGKIEKSKSYEQVNAGTHVPHSLNSYTHRHVEGKKEKRAGKEKSV